MAVADALAPLTAKGWLVLHDRENPRGGNLDHVAVGPAGVAVIDAKQWTAEVEIDGATMRAAGRDRSSALDGVRGQVAQVAASLAEGHPAVPVHGYLALTGDVDRGRHLQTIREIRVVGVRELAPCLEGDEQTMDPRAVESVFRDLSVAFPPCAGRDARSPVQPAPPAKDRPADKSRFGMTFDSVIRTYYLKTWQSRGARHLYMKSADGDDLGWKDMVTGAVTMTDGGPDPELASAVLRAATATGVPLASADLPKVPVQAFGARMLGRVTRTWVAVLIGHEWRKGTAHRMYGTLIDPVEGHFKLGYVDLSNGRVHPDVDGLINKNLGTATGYLERLRDRSPLGARGRVTE